MVFIVSSIGGAFMKGRELFARATIRPDVLAAYLADGVISVPLAWSWRLSDATSSQRATWEIIGDAYGVHRTDIDEDISAEGMLHGTWEAGIADHVWLVEQIVDLLEAR